ncbi:MAG: adenylate/guanylate cyclase domain-containing response regulator [bacterium]|nr:adenylate/guanylate cyclase domain-containing response regulator [bacterium]
MLTNHLMLQNYTVEQAAGGAEALSLIEAYRTQDKRFDLIILDIMMPRMSGYEVSQKLREIYPAHELPIVMLTAKNQVADLMTGFQTGANDYMTKPFSKDELLTRIKNHLRLTKTTQSFGRFVPLEYLRFLEKESIIDVRLGDHVAKRMAVMFSDIRSFTTISEAMTSQENFDFVNAYLRRVSPTIREHHGFIVKFLGDGMMAVFPEGADNAVQAGVSKLNSVAQYNTHRKQEGGLTKYYGASLILSGETCRQLSNSGQYHIRFLDRVIVKGRTEPIEIYEVLDGEPPERMTLKLQTISTFTEGVERYQNRRFAEAKACFDEVLDVNQDDKAAHLYAERVNSFLTGGVPDDWDGITWMTAK